VLGTAKNQVSTVEHLLSALSGCAIDNCLIRVEGPEVPALDGSSLPFCVAVEQAGFLEQDEERQWFELDEPVWVEQNGSHLLAIPAEQLRVTYGIDFAHPVLGQQIFSAPVTRESYRQEIAPARTFGFLREIEELRRRGLALGGGMDNALVIAEDGYLSPLRFADEPVRHKVLDLLGDLALLGAPLRAHVIGLKTSHGLNVRLVEAIQNKRRRG
jgi:UDP-3-O-acyl N-acetylglucosamine deacetylase